MLSVVLMSLLTGSLAWTGVSNATILGPLTNTITLTSISWRLVKALLLQHFSLLNAVIIAPAILGVSLCYCSQMLVSVRWLVRVQSPGQVLVRVQRLVCSQMLVLTLPI